jgi:fructoselysine-6-P-deglycase FrlB-like protein
MDEMVASEPSLASKILRQDGQASAIADQVRRVLGERLPVAVVGCGTSETAAMAVAELLKERTAAMRGTNWAVQSRQALEAALDPWPGLCLGISHDGGTRATILALEAARKVGASTAVITARAGSEVAKRADALFVTPELDQSWCHTVGYLSPILAGAAIAQALTPMGLQFDAVERLTQSALALRQQARQVARILGRSEQIVVVGAGPDQSPAKELALKIEEGARIPSRMLELETLLHGHLAACDDRTGLVLIATADGDRQSGRSSLALGAARRIGLQVAAIVSRGLNARLDLELTSAGRIVLPEAMEGLGLIGRFSAAAVVLQLLTLELAGVRGSNPDLIGRDREAYREAAKIAEGDSSW